MKQSAQRLSQAILGLLRFIMAQRGARISITILAILPLAGMVAIVAAQATSTSMFEVMQQKSGYALIAYVILGLWLRGSPRPPIAVAILLLLRVMVLSATDRTGVTELSQLVFYMLGIGILFGMQEYAIHRRKEMRGYTRASVYDQQRNDTL